MGWEKRRKKTGGTSRRWLSFSFLFVAPIFRVDMFSRCAGRKQTVRVPLCTCQHAPHSRYNRCRAALPFSLAWSYLFVVCSLCTYSGVNRCLVIRDFPRATYRLLPTCVCVFFSRHQIINDNMLYAKTVVRMGVRTECKNCDFSDILEDEDVSPPSLFLEVHKLYTNKYLSLISNHIVKKKSFFHAYLDLCLSRKISHRNLEGNPVSFSVLY